MTEIWMSKFEFSYAREEHYSAPPCKTPPSCAIIGLLKYLLVDKALASL
jgi:hypothetical protein